MLIDDSSDGIIVYKSGGMIGGFLVFSPPSERVENSGFILEILVENSGD